MEYTLCLLRRHQNPRSRPSSPWPSSGITCLLHFILLPNLLLIFSLSLISPEWYSLAINHNKKLSYKNNEWSTRMFRNINVLRPFPFCPSPLYPRSLLTSTRPMVIVLVFCNNFSSNLLLKINFLYSQWNLHKLWLDLCSLSNPNQNRPNPKVTNWGLIRWFHLLPWRSRSVGWKRSLDRRPALLKSREERALECCWPIRGQGYEFVFLWCCQLLVVKNVDGVAKNVDGVPILVLLRPLRRRDESSSGALLVARKAFAGGDSVSWLLLEVWSSWRPTKCLSEQVPLKTRGLTLLIHENHSQEHFGAWTSQRKQQIVVPGVTLATLPYFFTFVKNHKGCFCTNFNLSILSFNDLPIICWMHQNSETYYDMKQSVLIVNTRSQTPSIGNEPSLLNETFMFLSLRETNPSSNHFYEQNLNSSSIEY